MANTSHNYFLPHLRYGLLTKATQIDGMPSRLGIAVNLNVGVTGVADSKPVTQNIGLYGAGDVLGFNERIVLRTDPVAHIGNFNPSHIPFIEFADADFLWRYSAKQQEGKYWIPWLALVVLKNKDGEEDGEFQVPEQATNPELPQRVELLNGAKLPNLEDTWRWAHVHTADREGRNRAFITEKIKADPRTAVCRLMCPRRLQAGVKYTAFVVPAYRLGFDAALGIEKKNAEEQVAVDALAWDANGERPKQLPYYYKWEFRTGRRGDFEYLIKQLEYNKLEGVGQRMIDVSNPGYGIKDIMKQQAFEGALKSSELVEAEETNMNVKAKEKLADVLNSRVDSNGEERVVPPVYGKWYVETRDSETYKLDKDEQGWIDELNLDFKHRYAAGLGVEYIKENQEALMKSAWEQLREIKKANRASNLKKFGRGLSTCMHKRLDRMEDNSFFQLSLAMQKKVRGEGTSEQNGKSNKNKRLQKSGGSTGMQTLRAQVNSSKLATNAGQLKSKKYIGQKFIRTVINDDDNKLSLKGLHTQIVSPLNTGKLRGRKEAARDAEEVVELVAQVSNKIKHSINPKLSIEKIACRRIEQFRKLEEAKEQEQGRDTQGLNAKKDVLRPILWYPEFHKPMYRYLRDKSQALLLPGLENVPQNTVALLINNNDFIESYMMGLNHEFAAELRWREYPTDMRGSYFRKFWDTTIYSVDDNEKEDFRTEDSAKKYRTALLDKFEGFSTVEDFEKVFNKTSGELTEEDRIAAKAYENAVEQWLLTREENKDLTKLEIWKAGDQLGSHINIGSGEGQIVLLIRGDILNKFPNMRVYLALKIKVKIDDDKSEEKPDYSDREFPIFEGNLPPDIVLLGFSITEAQAKNYFLVFEEPLAELRYGLDETDETDETQLKDEWTDTSWQHFGFTEENNDDYISTEPTNEAAKKMWNNPAGIAQLFTQKSVRVAIPLNRFLDN